MLSLSSLSLSLSLLSQVSLDLVGLANKYDFSILQQAIMSYLKATLTVANVCHVLNVSSFYQLKELIQACTSFVDMNAPQVMTSDGFLSLEKQALIELLSRDSFFAPEIDIFYGVQRWIESSECSSADIKELRSVLRLSLIPMEALLGVVRECKLFEDSEILDAIAVSCQQVNKTELKQRGLMSKWE